MKSIIFFVLCLFTACTPAEVCLIESATEDALIIEKDLFQSKNASVKSNDEIKFDKV